MTTSAQGVMTAKGVLSVVIVVCYNFANPATTNQPHEHSSFRQDYLSFYVKSLLFQHSFCHLVKIK